jgi:hypothetical protein
VQHGSPSVRNQCSRTVQLFIGDKPGYSGGIFTSVSGNSINGSLSRVNAGAKIWIVDDKRNPLSSMVVGQNVKEIIIGSDCVSFRVEMW